MLAKGKWKLWGKLHLAIEVDSDGQFANSIRT